VRKLAILLILALIITTLSACNNDQAVIDPDEELEEGIEESESIDKEENQEKDEPDSPDNESKETNLEEETVNTSYLSVYMTKGDIVESLGQEYNLVTEEEYGGVSYYSVLEYEGIALYYTHKEEELPEDAIADLIEITSNKYSYNFDLTIGNNLLSAIEQCEQKFENTFDVHTGKEIFNIFNYEEKNTEGDNAETGYVLRLDYESDQYYETKEEIPQNLKLSKISLFVPLD